MSQSSSVSQLVAARYFCTKPFSMAKGGVRSFKPTCKLLLKLVANLGPSWCLYITYKRLAHLENITLPNGLRGRGIHQGKCTISQVLLHHIVFFFAWIQHPCGLGEYARVKFLSWCTIFLRPNFPLTPFPSTLLCCIGNSFHLLTSLEGLRDVESIHLLGRKHCVAMEE